MKAISVSPHLKQEPIFHINLYIRIYKKAIHLQLLYAAQSAAHFSRKSTNNSDTLTAIREKNSIFAPLSNRIDYEICPIRKYIPSEEILPRGNPFPVARPAQRATLHLPGVP